MVTRNSASTKSTEQELVITRIFDAPRELVFRAWTDPQHVARWWGPGGFTMPVCELDARPGGVMRFHMRAPDGVIYPTTGTFHEVAAPERIVFTSYAYPDEAGNPRLEVLHTVTFAEHERGKTKLTLCAVVIKAAAEVTGALAGMEQGWNEGLDRLDAELRANKGDVDMSEDATLPTPDAELKKLDILVGTWNMSGEAQGQIRYEWMEGGFFLLQYVTLDHSGRLNKGIEVIGRERPFGASEPSADIKSRFYDSEGNTLDYVYEMDGNTLTIWGGEKGSSAYYRGQFSADGDTLAGRWVWPGGGYDTTSTRVK